MQVAGFSPQTGRNTHLLSSNCFLCLILFICLFCNCWFGGHFTDYTNHHNQLRNIFMRQLGIAWLAQLTSAFHFGQSCFVKNLNTTAGHQKKKCEVACRVINQFPCTYTCRPLQCIGLLSLQSFTELL